MIVISTYIEIIILKKRNFTPLFSAL